MVGWCGEKEAREDASLGLAGPLPHVEAFLGPGTTDDNTDRREELDESGCLPRALIARTLCALRSRSWSPWFLPRTRGAGELSQLVGRPMEATVHAQRPDRTTVTGGPLAQCLRPPVEMESCAVRIDTCSYFAFERREAQIVKAVGGSATVHMRLDEKVHQ